MDPFNVITALATTATAVFGYRKMLDQKPIFEAVVKDIPESDKRNRPAREKLQQEGYYILRLSLISAPQNWDIVAAKISGASIPCEITSKSGTWLADTLPDKRQIKMTHGKVKIHNWKIIQNETEKRWEFLIKPDVPEEGVLTLTLYGRLLMTVKVPFEYKQTHYIEPFSARESQRSRS